MVDQSIKDQARVLRHQGWGYQRIAKEINSSVTSVRRWVSDIPCDSQEAYRQSIESIKAGTFPKRKSAVRKRLIQERGNSCENCHLSKWLDSSIALEMHRLIAQGEYSRENVVLLCPNCHSQTLSWRRK
jgi:Zn finger protein HypA/HybF involved in hydrogenase expression